MAEMGVEPDPELDLESKIWTLTELGCGFGVLVFGSGSDFEVNFSNSAHLCCTPLSCMTEMGTDADLDQSGSEVRHIYRFGLKTDFEFSKKKKKTNPVCVVWCI